jgi:hypothetical protein
VPVYLPAPLFAADRDVSAYWSGEHKVADQAKLAEYLRQVVPMIERHGERYLTRRQPRGAGRRSGLFAPALPALGALLKPRHFELARIARNVNDRLMAACIVVTERNGDGRRARACTWASSGVIAVWLGIFVGNGLRNRTRVRSAHQG